ncbi:MAG: inorganic pyrophosphatase, partial [Betaproteobacteria bacterium]|nr:inorganic pyrophosphatase [Betaproteobacteria bacterium]
EPGKWVRVLGWEGPEAAIQEVMEGVANFRKEQGLA